MREDHSLYIDALEGFPGPYTNYFNKTMSVELLLKIMNVFENRNAHMELAATLVFPNGKTKNFIHKVPLKISKTIKGKKRNWDKILMLKESKYTFSENSKEDRTDIWAKNYEEIGKELKFMI